MFKLTTLTIRSLRYFVPNTTLKFGPCTNVLLGKNGVGKTSLLELVCNIMRSDFTAYQARKFDLEWTLESNGFVVRMVGTNNVEPPAVESMKSPNRKSSWTVRIDGYLAGDPEQSLSVKLASDGEARAELCKKSLNVDHSDLFRPGFLGHTMYQLSGVFEERGSIKTPIREACFRLASELLTASANLKRYDEALGSYDLITSSGTEGASFNISKHKDSSFVQSSRFVPSKVCELTSRMDVGEEAQVTLGSDALPFLQAFRRLTSFDHVAMHLFIQKRQIATVEVPWDTTQFGGFSFAIMSNRTLFLHNALSFGEKRLLSFLYHAACVPELLIADEPVNGLHYEWIRECVQVASEPQRQSFVTSQNPLLLDHISVQPGGRDLRPRFLMLSNRDSLHSVRNMTDAEEQMFGRYVSTAKAHVSEIMQDLGLW